MCFWIPFDGDPIEERSFGGPDTYKFFDEGVCIHVIDYGVNSGWREILGFLEDLAMQVWDLGLSTTVV